MISIFSGIVFLFLVVVEKCPVPAVDSSLIFSRMLISLDCDALSAQIGQYGINAVLVDGTEPRIGQAQAHPTVFGFDPEASILKVRQEPTLGLVVRMGNIVAHHRGFPRNLANACHGIPH